jgi:glutamine amidotransferase-like uncharacterized protein
MKRLALIALAAAAAASADTLLLKDGGVLEGRIVEVVVETRSGRRTLKGEDIDWERARLDAAWIEANLRFALGRREGAKARTAVFLGRGTFPASAQAVVRRLDEADLAPRLLFEEHLTADGLAGVRLLVMPGGWAPTQQEALGQRGRAALRAFVEGGGRYMGICAGAYLACTTVAWQGREYPYALGLARGRASGPVEGLAPWPAAGRVEIRAGGRAVPAVYAGGCALEIDGATVLATYSDGLAAAVEVGLGEGRILLLGVHPEFAGGDTDLLAGWADGAGVGDGAWFLALVEGALR